MTDEIKKINGDLQYIKDIYKKLIAILPSFNVTDKEILPYGLRPHTRSISWLVEQVITQQTKYRARKLGLDEVKIDMPDTCLHDCEINVNNKIYYINVKIHSVANKENKNDIAAVEKLYMQYVSNSEYNLIYVCFGVIFQNINIKFDLNYLCVFSPQCLPIYVNPRNDKIQAYYHHKPIFRSRDEFLKMLREESKSIVLPERKI